MATRVFFANSKGTPGITPAVASGWEVTSPGFGRYQGILTGTTDSSNDTPSAVGSGNANDDTCTFQLVLGPLAGATLTGTVKGQMAAREANAATDARAQMTIRVIAPDGSTVRGTPLAFDTAALSSEFNPDAAQRVNRKFPRGGATSLTSTTITAGDFLVIEWGFRNHGTNTSAVRMGAGSGTTDLAENETDNAETTVTTLRPWVEFSQTLSLLTAPTPTAATGTGTAPNAKVTIKPNAGLASGTGAAFDATVSFLLPPRTFTISSVDYTNAMRLDSFSFVECANRGEVGIGGIDVDDSANALTLPALKYAQFDEPSAGLSNRRVFSGFTHVRSTERGPNRVAGQRNWAVELVDLNTLADDYVITNAESGLRSAETDYARIIWLITSTAFGTTAVIGNGNVVNTNTVTMAARDYRGLKARDVLAECSEATNKLWFVYDYGAGRKLFYDTATGGAILSSAKISDVATDVDSSTVWAASAVSVRKNPDRIYSKIHYLYNGGVVTSSNATTATNYRTREAAVLDASTTDATLAQVKSDALLAGAGGEINEISDLQIRMPRANVNDIRAGQAVQIKLTRHGISAYAYHRVIKRQVQPLPGNGGASDVEYLVTLSLASDVIASANGSRGGDDVWQNKSNANDDGATVRIDRGGITITNGGITVTNGSSVVIIDGTSDMFKIAATGSQSLTVNGAGTTFDTTTTVVGSLGLSAAPLVIFTHSTTGTSAGVSMTAPWTSVATSFVAQTSGGAVTTKTVTYQLFGWGQTAYNTGTGNATLALSVYNYTGGSATVYQNYYVLKETSF